jgi:hypothetical protein
MAAAEQHRAVPTRTPPATAQFASPSARGATTTHTSDAQCKAVPGTTEFILPVRVWCILYDTPTRVPIRFGRHA